MRGQSSPEEQHGGGRPMAFALLAVDPEAVEDVRAALEQWPQTLQTYPVVGEFQVLAKFGADDYDALGACIQRARRLPGVRHGRTMLTHD